MLLVEWPNQLYCTCIVYIVYIVYKLSLTEINIKIGKIHKFQDPFRFVWNICFALKLKMEREKFEVH